jgi:Zn-dependent protease
MPTNGFRLFKIFGITVYLHWSWIIVAIFELQWRQSRYHFFAWNIAEYLTLFAIVLMHEFGHALACRSVGGTANRIVLWPLGGVAYVNPPLRPGAMLWSICAGPLVNVALLPLTLPFLWLHGTGDFVIYLQTIAEINVVLLIFNVLPIYPLDGGKILWSLLWFVMGIGRSLMIASVIGIIGAVGFGVFALLSGSIWLGVIAAFAVIQAFVGVKNARELRRRETIQRRSGLACPNCHTSPPIGPFWECPNCHTRFDAFDFPTACPSCGMPHQTNPCLTCGARAPYAAWNLSTQIGHAIGNAN